MEDFHFFFRAIALGLTSDEMAQIDNFIEELKLKKQEVEIAEEIKKEAQTDVFKIKVCKLLHYSLLISIPQIK